MLQDQLKNELSKVATRYTRLLRWQMLAAVWLVGGVVIFIARSQGISLATRSPAAALKIGLGLVSIITLILLRWRPRTIDDSWTARQVEAQYPNLNSCLITAVEQSPELPGGRYGFLQESVVRQALDHANANDWSRVVSARRMSLAMTASFATFGLLVWIGMARPAHPNAPTLGLSKSGKPNSFSASDFSVTVEPGNTELERGSSLMVLARVTGSLPPDAKLFSISTKGESSESDGRKSGSLRPAVGGEDSERKENVDREANVQEMSASLDDPVFGGRIAGVTESFDYWVELGGKQSARFHATVFEFPRLERADAKLNYPQYTELEPKFIQDIRTISVVEGTEVKLICQLNKAVKTARFVDAPSKKMSTNASDARQLSETKSSLGKGEAEFVLHERRDYKKGEHDLYETTFIAQATRRLQLELIDEAGRRNTEQALIVVQVVPNLPPTLKLIAPARDLEVSPLEELDVKATAWDDYGLKRIGMTYGIAGKPTVDVTLGENAVARQKHEIADLIQFEALKAEPDQLLAYYFWADDLDSNGKLRRTSTDMYFAEVRHFDEIFRQGQQPPGGQQQQQQQRQQQQGSSPNGQAAQQLAQLQKDIINATWNLIRRETSDAPSAAFADDVKQISESQSQALQQAHDLFEKVRDSESQGHLQQVLDAMNQAIKQLTSSLEQPAKSPLPFALAAEQSAYQNLLKLRAREHEVVRQQQQSSSSSSSQAGRSQQQRQQMQQLDLSNEENRYEAQRLAQSQQEKPEDRETRQVLNRLKELARRQHDLNERLKDLQSALQEAQTEQKKDEIRQQLKRLQEEQRDVLRDTDELQSRMETPENQERMTEERQQLEQAREQVQRASQALEKDQVTQAAAAGTRAERQLDELRNEFRKQTSSQFNDEVRELREEARNIHQREEKLAQDLKETTKPDAPKTLRDDTRGEAIEKGFNEQKEKLSHLSERLKKTIEAAEQTEPLLSEKLHDASRTLQDQQVSRALETAARSVRLGFVEDAQEVERIAGRGINQFKEGIEKAAESVLGDETEALRRAREQLKNLADELNQELVRNAPEEQLKSPPDRMASANSQPLPESKDKSPEKSNVPAESSDPSPKMNGGRDRNGSSPQNSQRPSAEPSSAPGRQSPRGQQNEERNNEAGSESRSTGEEQRAPGNPGNAENRSNTDRSRPDRQSNSRSNENGRGGEAQRQSASQTPQNEESAPGESRAGQAPMSPSQGTQTNDSRSERGAGGQDRRPPAAGQQQSNDREEANAESRNPGAQGNSRARTTERNGQTRGNSREGGGVSQSEAVSTSPISGQDFLNWSDRLRDVEEMVDDPELRAEAARIRDQAKSIRAEMKRHSQAPNWKLVRVNVAEPLAELTNRVSEELLRRNSKQAVVPLDRDPVPPKYSEKTRRYYERLGIGQ